MYFKMGVSRVSSSKAIQGEWFGLAGLWSPSELSTILSGSLKAVWKQGHAVVRGDREDQAGEASSFHLLCCHLRI